MTTHPRQTPSGQTPRARSAERNVDAEAPPVRDTLVWVREILTETSFNPEVEIIDVQVLRDGRKKLVAVTLMDGTSLVLKQYANDRGGWTHKWMDNLCDAGFKPPSRFSVTPARGWSRTHRTLVADMAPDFPWTAWHVGSAAASTMAAGAAADWLVALQELKVRLPDRSEYRAANELEVQRWELSEAFPSFAGILNRIHDGINSLLYQASGADAVSLVPSHGDLHPNNLHIADDAHLSVMAIDVDTAGMRRPSYDVGYAIAQMLIVSWMRTGSFQVGAAAAQIFWRRWNRNGEAPDAGAVGAECARALLQSLHFELVTYRNARTDLLVPWLAVANSMLTAGVPSTLHALATETTTAR